MSECSFPFYRFSNLRRIKPVIAYCLNFVSNAKLLKGNRIFGLLSASELDKGMKVLVQLAQGKVFADDINKLGNNKINVKNNVSCLSPFLDK